MVRGDSMFGTEKVITTCVADRVHFSLSVSRNKRASAAIAAIDEAAYTPVHYPGAVEDPDTGQLISDAQVAETPYPLRLGRGRTLTARLVVRRSKTPATPMRCFRCGAITRLSPTPHYRSPRPISPTPVDA